MGVQERRLRERTARRKSVLDATRVLVRERGYNGTTTKQIAAACELSEATLFWYFQSKDEIFTSLLFEAIDFMQERIEALDTADAPPEQLLREVWSLFAELRSGFPEYFYVFTSLASPEATAAVSPEVKAELVRRSGENFRRVSQLAGRAIAGQRPVAGSPDGHGSGRAANGDPAGDADQLSTAWTRIVTDLLWAAFLGLGVLHDSRANLGAPVHPTQPELDQALNLLLTGVSRAGQPPAESTR